MRAPPSLSPCARSGLLGGTRPQHQVEQAGKAPLLVALQAGDRPRSALQAGERPRSSLPCFPLQGFAIGTRANGAPTCIPMAALQLQSNTYVALSNDSCTVSSSRPLPGTLRPLPLSSLPHPLPSCSAVPHVVLSPRSLPASQMGPDPSLWACSCVARGPLCACAVGSNQVQPDCLSVCGAQPLRQVQEVPLSRSAPNRCLLPLT